MKGFCRGTGHSGAFQLYLCPILGKHGIKSIIVCSLALCKHLPFLQLQLAPHDDCSRLNLLLELTELSASLSELLRAFYAQQLLSVLFVDACCKPFLFLLLQL